MYKPFEKQICNILNEKIEDSKEFKRFKRVGK